MENGNDLELINKNIFFPEIYGLLDYHTTPCNYPEDHRFHQHSGGSLKSIFFPDHTNMLTDGTSAYCVSNRRAVVTFRIDVNTAKHASSTRGPNVAQMEGQNFCTLKNFIRKSASRWRLQTHKV
jgi:hypothetical protein